jgi:hypothetical protein|uniref:Uncharacterized protein FLAS10H9.27 n=1 Tax=uncultured haloarchaeon FLAS10H9 TaxID=447098 RepID=A7U0V5_9EURY|nr:hypothetical protein [uncultured haloarchaeon FLAS10H9]
MCERMDRETPVPSDATLFGDLPGEAGNDAPESVTGRFGPIMSPSQHGFHVVTDAH